MDMRKVTCFTMLLITNTTPTGEYGPLKLPMRNSKDILILSTQFINIRKAYD